MHEDKDRRETYQKEHCVRRWQCMAEFYFLFSKMLFNIFSFEKKKKKPTVVKQRDNISNFSEPRE